MKTMLVATLLLLSLPIDEAKGHLPLHWSAEHGRGDIAGSNLIASVRVIGLRLEQELVIKVRGTNGQEVEQIRRDYTAELLLVEVFKDIGDQERLLAGSKINLPVGSDWQAGKDPLVAVPAVHPALVFQNHQQGYDLRIGQSYVLFLKRMEKGYDLRSGPFSIYWLQSNNRYCSKDLNRFTDSDVGADKMLKELKDLIRTTTHKPDDDDFPLK